MAPVSGVSLGGDEVPGEPGGLPLGSIDGDGGATLDEGVAAGLDEGVAAGVEHAARPTSTTSRIGTCGKRRIGLVGMEADVGSLHGRQRAVTEQARLLAQELELGT